MVGTYFAVSCGSLNTKEKIFMAFAWMPKATVQAALGPVFLDNCIKYGKDEWQPMGEEILTLAVLSILITAPLGAVCILGMIKINISTQTLQLFTHLHINKYKGLLFYLDLKCLFCLSPGSAPSGQLSPGRPGCSESRDSAQSRARNLPRNLKIGCGY